MEKEFENTNNKNVYAELNVHQKLMLARMKLVGIVKKTGELKLKETKKSYFTLDDIQTPVTATCAEIGLCTVFNFTKETATLKVINNDNPAELIIFESPMCAIVAGEKQKEIQVLGGIETYQRRYLYCVAFDIVEPNSDDATKDDLDAHDIFKIKKRIEEKCTEALKQAKGGDTVAALIGITPKQYDAYMKMFEQINAFEKIIDRINARQ